MRIWSWAILLTAATLAWGDAGDVYVDNETGLDSSNGAQPVLGSNRNGPVRTISQAYRRAVPGGRIILLPTGSPYRESVVFWGGRVHGYSHAPIILEGNGQILTGVVPIDPIRWERQPGGYARLLGPVMTRDLLFRGDQPLPRATAALWGARPNLQPGQYAVWDGAVLFRMPMSEAFRPIDLSESKLEGGLLIKRAANLVVRNLTIRGFSIDGVQVWGPVAGVRFERCRFEHNARAGLFVSTNSSVELVECSLENNGEADLIADNFARVKLTDSAIGAGPRAIQIDATSKVDRSGQAPRQARPQPAVPIPGYRTAPAPPVPSPPTPASPAPRNSTAPPADKDEDPSDS